MFYVLINQSINLRKFYLVCIAAVCKWFQHIVSLITNHILEHCYFESFLVIFSFRRYQEYIKFGFPILEVSFSSGCRQRLVLKEDEISSLYLQARMISIGNLTCENIFRRANILQLFKIISQILKSKSRSALVP